MGHLVVQKAANIMCHASPVARRISLICDTRMPYLGVKGHSPEWRNVGRPVEVCEGDNDKADKPSRCDQNPAQCTHLSPPTRNVNHKDTCPCTLLMLAYIPGAFNDFPLLGCNGIIALRGDSVLI